MELARAEDAAAVSTAAGTVVVEKADGAKRPLAPGAKVEVGDVVTTEPASSTRLKFTDGGEVTLSAKSRVKIENYSFHTAAPKSDHLVYRLLKGGLRAITGLIGKRGNEDAYRLHAATATMGIRGTDFMVRLCEEDCAQEMAQPPSDAAGMAPEIAARVAVLAGKAAAVDRLGKSRPLSVGSPVFQSDIVETEAKSHALLMFVDEGRVTVQADTRLLLVQFRYEPARPAKGQSVMRLLRGGIRVQTGLLSKQHPEGYVIETVTGSISVAGTGFDASCRGACEGTVQRPGPAPAVRPPVSPDDATSGLFVNTWQGQVVVKNAAGTQTAGVGQTVRIAAKDSAPALLSAAPPFMGVAAGPRPDAARINMQQLFGTVNKTEPGMYVLVSAGKIVLTQGRRILELNRGESAYLSADGSLLYRLRLPPSEVFRELLNPPARNLGIPNCSQG
jgi:hypothetical protein